MTLKHLFSVLLIGFFSSAFVLISDNEADEEVDNATIEEVVEFNALENLYISINIPEVEFSVFEMAMKGYSKLLLDGKVKNEDYLTIVDFSKTSDQKRLFLIDLKNQEVVEKSLVAHGRNTGANAASKFSNIPQSYQSSLGFYLTAETYTGKHGHSLRLDGMEANFNDKARERAIVIHGADYVSENFVTQHGRLGRSFGCPALPRANSKEIIETIKNKSCLFIYHPNDDYLTKSQLINSEPSADWLAEVAQ